MNRSITVPGHELEFVDELYRRDEEGQGFTTTRLGSSQNIPTEKQTDTLCMYPQVTLWSIRSNQLRTIRDLPSLQQGTNTFVLDLSHVFKAHLLHGLQRVITHHPSKRGKGRVLKCS